MIERQIIIGAIVSTEYLNQVRDIWNVQHFESVTAKRLARWIWQYYQSYNKAPGKHIETIFYDKVKTEKLNPTVADEIENEILPSLSKQYEQNDLNLDYLIEATKKYFKERGLTIFKDSIAAALDKNDLILAEQIASDYKPLNVAPTSALTLNDPIVLDRVDRAFNSDSVPLITYPGILGEFWNAHLVRGGFVALLGPEKRGKSLWLLDLAIRACKQKRKVVFFQAGDMNESAQLRRICIYLAQKSNQERYCGKMYEPVCDCVLNQINQCKKEERTCPFGVFPDKNFSEVKYEINKSELVEKYLKEPDYEPCTCCDEYKTRHLGTPWVKEIEVKNPLSVDEAKSWINDFFIKYGRGFKLSTHPIHTLSVRDINAILDIWEKQEEFVPDVIIVDYADIMMPEGSDKDFRHSQNKIWMGLRNLSQTRGNPLVITATQADAASYERNSLKMTNFSEDKRKYSHVTFMAGLNQDPKDREKKIGIMRLNAIVAREGEFYTSNEVTVLQNLKRGRPFIGSYL
jgi:6-pyruvoyl-tetrahydropterin synthase